MLAKIKSDVKKFLAVNDAIKQLFKKLVWIVLLFEIIKLVPPIMFKYIIDYLVSDGTTLIETTFYLVGGYVGSLFFMSVIETISMRAFIHGTNAAEVAVMGNAFKKLLSLDLHYHESNSTGTAIAKLIRGGGKLVDLLWNTGWGLLPVLYQAVLTFCVLLWISWEIALWFLICVPIFITLLMRGARITAVVRERYYRCLDQYGASITQSMANVRTVKDFANEDKEYKQADKHLMAYHKNLMIRTQRGQWNMVLENSFINFARGCILILCVWLMSQGNITAGSLVLAMTMSEKAFTNLSRLSRFYYRALDSEPAIDRFNRLKKQEPFITDDKTSKYKVQTGDITFNNVSFSYPGARASLKNVTLTIPEKSTVAVVGRSGAGKSTIIKLILRHYDATKGSLEVGGRNVKDYSFKNLRSHIGIVSQDVELFDDTVFNNLTYGGKATRKEVIKACKMAHAHHFIKELPKGYNTIVGERGVKLSGGQKQRVAIARALLRKPKIMIFDEATSSLDAESEKFIHESIFNLIGKVTLIIIAHRFSTIEHADQIILLEKGRVKEVGTHQQLIKKKGIFAKLRKLQELGELE